jgi:DNA-binding cell septation regulator SpoVG
MSELVITDVQFAGAPPGAIETGLIGFVAVTVNDTLRLDGLALRRTETGRLALSFPARKDRVGRQRFYYRPVDDDARREIEARVFRALGIDPMPP